MKNLHKLKTLFVILSVAVLFCAAGVSAAADVDNIAYGESYVPVYASAGVPTTASGESVDPALLEYFIEMHRECAEEIPIYGEGYRISLLMIEALQYARVYEAPDLFYVSNRYSYSYCTEGDNVYLYAIYPRYTMTGAALSSARAEYEEMIEHIAKQASHLDSELEIALFYHEYIVANCEYDLDYAIYDSYNMLKNKKGVCQAYTLLYSELLNRAGIENVAVISDGLNHAWNALRLGGKWYLADLTWDDPLNDVPGRVYHDFFLRSASKFGHTLPDGSRDWYTADGRTLSYSGTYDSAFWIYEYKWIHVWGGSAYYQKNNDGATYIYSCELDTMKSTAMFEVKSDSYTANGWFYSGALGFCGYGDRLYFAESTEYGTVYIYEYDLDTSVRALAYTYTHSCTSSCDEYCSMGPLLLFSDGNTIYYLEAVNTHDESRTVRSFTVDEYVMPLDMDADGDGSVSNSDITVMLRYLSGWQVEGFCFSNADTNNDSKINNRDLIALIRFLSF